MLENPRVAYVHIGKSAGTWLRTNLQKQYDLDEICPFIHQHQFDNANLTEYTDKKLFSAHIGYETAACLNARMITVLRNPFDRILSLYYYWQEVDGAPKIVQGMSFEDFIESKHPTIVANVENNQTWQIAFGFTTDFREKYADINHDELLKRAISNIEKFSVIGVFEKLDWVRNKIKAEFNFDIPTLEESNKINKTNVRMRIDDLPTTLRNKIYDRVHLDVALYDHVLRKIFAETM